MWVAQVKTDPVTSSVLRMVLADAALEKFGGDSLDETRRNCDSYLADLAGRNLSVVVS